MKEIIVSDYPTRIIIIMLMISILLVIIDSFIRKTVEVVKGIKEVKPIIDNSKKKLENYLFVISAVIDYIILIKLYFSFDKNHILLIVGIYSIFYTFYVISYDFKLSTDRNMVLCFSSIIYIALGSNYTYNALLDNLKFELEINELLEVMYISFKTFFFFFFIFLLIGIFCNIINNSIFFKKIYSKMQTLYKNTNKPTLNGIYIYKISSHNIICMILFIIVYIIAIPIFFVKQSAILLLYRVKKLLIRITYKLLKLFTINEQETKRMLYKSLIITLVIIDIILYYYKYSAGISNMFSIISTIFLIPYILSIISKLKENSYQQTLS